ncbi:hypothetical protein [Amycolatopsis sp. lyj-109]|uniref:hypothetical protein n=1 Tax=Amycolatopsis sp. lyj-109 TaxID=2789287 RepID=UPI003979B87A
MGELAGVLVKGIIVVAGNLLTMIDTVEVFGGRRARARGGRAGRAGEYPCVLRSEELTAGRERRGWLVVGDGPGCPSRRCSSRGS